MCCSASPPLHSKASHACSDSFTRIPANVETAKMYGVWVIKKEKLEKLFLLLIGMLGTFGPCESPSKSKKESVRMSENVRAKSRAKWCACSRRGKLALETATVR